MTKFNELSCSSPSVTQFINRIVSSDDKMILLAIESTLAETTIVSTPLFTDTKLIERISQSSSVQPLALPVAPLIPSSRILRSQMIQGSPELLTVSSNTLLLWTSSSQIRSDTAIESLLTIQSLTASRPTRTCSTSTIAITTLLAFLEST